MRTKRCCVLNIGKTVTHTNLRPFEEQASRTWRGEPFRLCKNKMTPAQQSTASTHRSHILIQCFTKLGSFLSQQSCCRIFDLRARFGPCLESCHLTLFQPQLLTRARKVISKPAFNTKRNSTPNNSDEFAIGGEYGWALHCQDSCDDSVRDRRPKAQHECNQCVHAHSIRRPQHICAIQQLSKHAVLHSPLVFIAHAHDVALHLGATRALARVDLDTICATS